MKQTLVRAIALVTAATALLASVTYVYASPTSFSAAATAGRLPAGSPSANPNPSSSLTAGGVLTAQVRPGEPGGRPAASPSPAPPASVSPDAALPRSFTDDAANGNSRARPHLELMQPAGDGVAVTEAIVMTFSQPMARASVEHAFSVQPAVEGSLVWHDDFTVAFKPFHLDHSVTYEVTVGGRSLRGKPVEGVHSWRFTTAAAPPVSVAPGQSALRVPILMYHYIRINPDANDRLGFALSVTPADFAAQMDWLAASGYHPITFRELNAYLNGTAGLPGKPVILTFDDGYEDFFTAALPVLLSHDFKAVAYVVSGFVDQPGYMTGAQIRKADRAGIEIGSHTVSHVDLTKQSAGALGFQVTASKQALEQLLGHPVLSFCYPSGKFNGAVVAAVQAAGYRDATTTQWGSVRTLGGRYTWGRLRIRGGESAPTFAADVERFS